MKKFLGYILTPIHYIGFGFFLCLFDPIQRICFHFGGYKTHKKVVDCLNFCLTATYYFLGNTVKFNNKQHLPIDRPIIFIANHQSMYDIPPMIYFLRKHHAKYISKIELAKARIPSISYNLVHGGAANIDRKDTKQSIAEILKLANNMKQKNWSAFIYPEGTRSATGQMKPFMVGGVATLLKKNPNALIVPIAIQNTWKMVQYGAYPLNAFTKLSWDVLQPIEAEGKSAEDVVKEAEQTIKLFVRQYNS